MRASRAAAGVPRAVPTASQGSVIPGNGYWNTGFEGTYAADMCAAEIAALEWKLHETRRRQWEVLMHRAPPSAAVPAVPVSSPAAPTEGGPVLATRRRNLGNGRGFFRCWAEDLQLANGCRLHAMDEAIGRHLHIDIKDDLLSSMYANFQRVAAGSNQQPNGNAENVDEFLSALLGAIHFAGPHGNSNIELRLPFEAVSAFSDEAAVATERDGDVGVCRLPLREGSVVQDGVYGRQPLQISPAPWPDSPVVSQANLMSCQASPEPSSARAQGPMSAWNLDGSEVHTCDGPREVSASQCPSEEDLNVTWVADADSAGGGGGVAVAHRAHADSYRSIDGVGCETPQHEPQFGNPYPHSQQQQQQQRPPQAPHRAAGMKPTTPSNMQQNRRNMQTRPASAPQQRPRVAEDSINGGVLLYGQMPQNRRVIVSDRICNHAIHEQHSDPHGTYHKKAGCWVVTPPPGEPSRSRPMRARPPSAKGSKHRRVVDDQQDSIIYDDDDDGSDEDHVERFLNRSQGGSVAKHVMCNGGHSARGSYSNASAKSRSRPSSARAAGAGHRGNVVRFTLGQSNSRGPPPPERQQQQVHHQQVHQQQHHHQQHTSSHSASAGATMWTSNVGRVHQHANIVSPRASAEGSESTVMPENKGPLGQGPKASSPPPRCARQTYPESRSGPR